jgi:two-component system, chemotaxis family, protein-glutamate methylesterase/glutaminase
MKRVRVLVVDDSVVVRRILRDVLAGDPMLEVIGVAANGRIALSMVEQLSPDVITLDVEMPEMDGLETLRHLRVSFPKLPVIMFSTLTQRGAVETLDALALGARDYVTKPANVGSVTTGMERIRTDLLPKIKALCGVSQELAGPPPEKRLSLPRTQARELIVDIVAIGTSTGGPNALTEVLPQLPADFPVPVLVVQHMPPTFTKFLADRLNASCKLHVQEAGMEQPLEPGTIWIAAGDFHLAAYAEGTRRRLRSHRAPPENSCRPAVDVLFRSVAETYRGHALAVVMTGMGQDGWRGAEQLHQVGAQIVAQDEATSVVWGMPGFVVQAGLADKVLPLPQIAAEIVRRVMMGHRITAMMGD